MTDVDRQWPDDARRLAGMLVLPDSRWRVPIETMPRHAFFPRWFERVPGGGWVVRDGASRPDEWLETAYRRTASVVTQVGTQHADAMREGDREVVGLPTSSATNPWRVIEMYRAARIHPGCGDVLDVGTGSGYGAGVLSVALGQEHVTTIDVDPYLTRAATERLALAAVTPRVVTGDATGAVDWEGDRIVSMVAVCAIPASWLTALKTGGRLAVNIAGTLVTVTARKLEDGSAWGRVELDYRGGFMRTRGPGDHPPSTLNVLDDLPVDSAEDAATTTSPFPVLDLDNAPELSSVLTLTVPGIGWTHHRHPDGSSTARLAHPDGSWAKAEGRHNMPATVHQAGPRRLWDELDRIRSDWLTHGTLHLYGAEVRIEPDGTAHFEAGPWRATLPAADQDQNSG